MFLMLKDKPVLQFDIDNGIYKEINPELLPIRMRGSFLHDSKNPVKESISNYNVLIDYLASRVLNLDRRNAKKILNAFNLTQSQSPVDKAKIAITCRIVSMVDSYWLKFEDDEILWQDLDPKQNSLNKIVTQIALMGTNLTLEGHPHTPELAGQGSYAKAWVREDDGVYLYKRNTKLGREAEIEISVSKVLEHFNVDHVEYKAATFDNEFMCKCKNMLTPQYDVVTAEDNFVYCNHNKLDFLTECLAVDAESIYKMWIIDYLISNSDRHMQNWGFYVDNETGKLVKCHPLFDHNNAFSSDLLENLDGVHSMVFTNHSQREAALYAMKHCNFRCKKFLKQETFIDSKCYESFMKKAEVLGLYEYVKPNLTQKLRISEYNPYKPVENCNLF